MKGKLKKIDKIALEVKLGNTAFFKGLGFKKEHPDNVDPTCFWWIKKYKNHPLFKNLEIIVEQNGMLAVWVSEKDIVGRNDVMITKLIYTEDNLEKVCKFFNQEIK